MIKITDRFEDERGYIVTASELFITWNELRNNHYTEANFDQYVAECCGKNGTLRRVGA